MLKNSVSVAYKVSLPTTPRNHYAPYNLLKRYYLL